MIQNPRVLRRAIKRQQKIRQDSLRTERRLERELMIAERRIKAAEAMRKRGRTYREIAERFGCNHSMVWQLLNYRYRHRPRRKT